LRKLDDEEIEKISEFAVVSAENFIFRKVSKKEIIDLDIRVEIQQDEVLNVDIEVDIVLDEISNVDRKIVDDAADHTIEEIDKFINHIAIFKEDETHRQKDYNQKLFF